MNNVLLTYEYSLSDKPVALSRERQALKRFRDRQWSIFKTENCLRFSLLAYARRPLERLSLPTLLGYYFLLQSKTYSLN